MSDSLQPCGLVLIRLLCPWDSPGKNIGVACRALFQGIFPTQGSNLHLLWLLHCRQILYFWATGKPNDGNDNDKKTIAAVLVGISLYWVFKIRERDWWLGWQSRRMCTHLLLPEHQITTNCWTAIDRKALEPTKKRYPTSKDKGEATVKWSSMDLLMPIHIGEWNLLYWIPWFKCSSKNTLTCTLRNN